MRIAQMKRREDFDQILIQTLARGWSEERGEAVDVSRDPLPGGQRFQTQPLLNAYFTATLCRAGRRFLRDGIRFTPHRMRLPVQWALSGPMTRRSALNVASKDAFWVAPPFARGETRLVIPGNQRVRVFDFDLERSRVFPKVGFSPDGMLREIALRMGPIPGPFLPILSSSAEGSYLEEAIIQGWDLNRTPPWRRPTRLRRHAQRLLARWLERTRERKRTVEVVDAAREAYLTALAAARARFPRALPDPLETWADALAERANAGSVIDVARTHGDFQRGNIFVTRARRDVILIDWEHQGIRSMHYDFFTEGLGARTNQGRGARLRRYLAGGKTDSPIDDLHPAKRRQALALFLLEDLTFFLKESVAGPLRAPSEGLLGYLDALAHFGPTLSGLTEDGAR